jgi:hypothetical protein
MKKVLVSFFVILSAISASFAALRYIPLEEAVRENDLIIIGTLKDISESSSYDGFTINGTGKIIVEQYIAGNVRTFDGSQLKLGDELRLDYVEDFACVYGSHKRIENQQGIFLLKIKANGEIQSKDFRYLNDLAEINKLLKNQYKTSQDGKSIKTVENETSQPVKTIKMYDELKSNDYSPISAFFTVFISIALYYFLYRNKFKIR